MSTLGNPLLWRGLPPCPLSSSSRWWCHSVSGGATSSSPLLPEWFYQHSTQTLSEQRILNAFIQPGVLHYQGWRVRQTHAAVAMTRALGMLWMCPFYMSMMLEPVNADSPLSGKWKITLEVLLKLQIPMGFGWVKKLIVDDLKLELGNEGSPFNALVRRLAEVFHKNHWKTARRAELLCRSSPHWAGNRT